MGIAPRHHARRSHTPVFYAHGAQDLRVVKRKHKTMEYYLLHEVGTLRSLEKGVPRKYVRQILGKQTCQRQNAHWTQTRNMAQRVPPNEEWAVNLCPFHP
jgi:hypothetical protein